ncbi:MBL fold metallo-hydrolase [Asinibacterium sp. OR53]|uniref:MBL fold metallo-hydrolase n=1 Tax=Asinibacterium sp. OR53 TaxID=925409 RepID=UPI0018DBFC65|nr:MBL fold metallo-hydrolase [Asinibacterium sp. OR53]
MFIKRMKGNHIQLVRHATLIITLGNTKLLIDPMLSAKGAMDPVQNCGNDTRFPMVDLPFDEAALDKKLNEADAVFVTHLHRDHWDAAAQQRINKDKPVFCQPSDLPKIREQGFTNVTPVESTLQFKDIKINRTGGQHGTGEIGHKMGTVSGYVFSHKDTVIYVAGDTVWCEEVQAALHAYKPAVSVLNAGGARFLTGDPITMTPDDIIKVQEAFPATQLVAVHMDTVNHCFIKRTDLKAQLAMKSQSFQLMIPADGETLIIK